MEALCVVVAPWARLHQPLGHGVPALVARRPAHPVPSRRRTPAGDGAGLALPAAAVADPCVDALQDFLGRAFGAPAACSPE
jgi:hypothetical protein